MSGSIVIHNVPEDELYTGEDGITRPYALIFAHQEGPQPSGRAGLRRPMTETGSFGKSIRRSRSTTATAQRRADPTLDAADKLFGSWVSQQKDSSSQANPPPKSPRQSAGLPSSLSQPNLVGPGNDDDAFPSSSSAASHRLLTARKRQQEPIEVVLRGYRSAAQQYAAINHYEQLAGRICEDYPRDPPPENRRYKSELRDPAVLTRRALTPDERAKVNRADGGEHWVKVTFESAEAAETAIAMSPQILLGHIVYAEPYRVEQPVLDEAIPNSALFKGFLNADTDNSNEAPAGAAVADDPDTAAWPEWMRGRGGRVDGLATLPRPRRGLTTRPSVTQLHDVFSPPDALTYDSASSMTNSFPPSSRPCSEEALMRTSGIDVFAAADTAPATTSSDAKVATNNPYCRTIPTARRVQLMPAEQALLPQPSRTQRILSCIPFLSWFSGSMIGNEVPRTEAGEFDWDRASLYWKMMHWLDATFGLFGGEIVSVDKDE